MAIQSPSQQEAINVLESNEDDAFPPESIGRYQYVRELQQAGIEVIEQRRVEDVADQMFTYTAKHFSAITHAPIPTSCASANIIVTKF